MSEKKQRVASEATIEARAHVKVVRLRHEVRRAEAAQKAAAGKHAARVDEARMEPAGAGEALALFLKGAP